MAVVIRAYVPVPGTSGEYVKSYDPEAFDGCGDVQLTLDIREAIHFSSFNEAMAYAGRVPDNYPTRDDGKPNRPLTALTLEFLEIMTLH